MTTTNAPGTQQILDDPKATNDAERVKEYCNGVEGTIDWWAREGRQMFIDQKAKITEQAARIAELEEKNEHDMDGYRRILIERNEWQLRAESALSDWAKAVQDRSTITSQRDRLVAAAKKIQCRAGSLDNYFAVQDLIAEIEKETKL